MIFLFGILLFAQPTSLEQFFPTQLIITRTAFQDGQVLGGIPFGPTVVELKDAAFNTVPVNDGRFITATLLSDGQSSLAGDVALRFGVTASNGTANFTSLEVRKLCVQCRLHFECQGLQVDSQPFNVVQSPPATIRVVSIAPSGVVNVDLDPTTAIQLLDSGGNLITTQFSANISKQSGFGQLRNRRNVLTNTSVTTLNNTLFFTEIFFDSPDNYAIRFDALIPGGVVVSTVVPSLLLTNPVVKAFFPSFQSSFAVDNQTALIPFSIQPIISAFDFFDSLVIADTGSVVVTASLLGGDPAGSLIGNTEVATVLGVAEFTDLSVDKVGRRYSIAFSNPQFPTLTTDEFNVFHGSISSLEVFVQPSTIIAGELFDPTPVVHVLDAGRNLFPGATAVSVSLADSSEGGLLLGHPSLFIVNADRGVAPFPGLSLATVGSSFQLLFQTAQQFSVLSQPFEVHASSPASIVMATQPGSALRGILLSVAPQVSLLDIFGNVVTDISSISRVEVELIGESQQATLAGTTQQVFRNGSAVFGDLSVNNPAPNYILRFKANETLITDSEPFTITGLVSDLQIITQPEGASGGTAFGRQPVVALIDSNRQVVATASNVIEVSLIPGPNLGVLSPIPARAESSFGVVTFTDLSVDIAGAGYRLQFRTLLGSSISQDSDDFSVAVGPPHRLTMVVQPTDNVAALPLEPSPSVSVVDAGGNTVDDSSSLVAQLVLRGVATETFFVGISAGTAVLNSTIETAGSNYRLLFLFSAPAAQLTVQSSPFSVVPGDAARLSVDVQPQDAIVGIDFFLDPVVSVRDAGGNRVPTYSSPLVVSRGEGPSGSYPIGNLSVAPVGGVAVFSGLQISDTAKIYQLLFRTERLGVALEVLSDVFAITLDPRRLVLLQIPEREIAGEPFSISTILEVLDSEGTRVNALADPFNASVGGPAQLFGTTRLNATAGVVEFADLAIDLAGFHEVSFAFQRLTVSYVVEIEVGEPSALTIATQPANCMTATKFFIAPRVRFLDKGGNVVPGVTDQVDVTVLQNAGASSLQGDTSKAASDGIAVFDNLEMVGLGNGFTLLFSSGGYAVESARFSVQGEVTSLGLVYFPAGVILDQNIDPFIKIAVLDDALNVIDGGKWRAPFVQVEVSLPTLTYPGISTPNIEIAGTTTAVVERGVAVFTDLRVTADTSLYQGVMLEFTTNLSTPVLSSPFFAPSFAENELVLKQEPRTLQTTGLTLVPFPVLEVLDGLNANVRGSSANCLVALTGSSVPAALAGTTSITAAGGVFTFTDLSIQKASEPGEQYTLVFTVEDRADIVALSTSAFTVIIGPAAIIEFQSGLLFQSSGLAFPVQPCIALQDAGRNLIRSDATVSASLLGPAESALVGETAAAASGLAAFTDMTVSQVVPGAMYRIAFFSEGLQLVSAPFTGISGPPASVEVDVQPPDVVSSSVFATSPVVRVVDAGGTLVEDLTHVTANLVGRDGLEMPAAVSGGVAETVNGTATFSQLTVAPAGEGFTLQFVAGVASVMSHPFNVRVGPGVRLAIGSEPSASVFGVNLHPTPSIVVLDAGENWVSTASVMVTLALILPGEDGLPPTVLSGETQRSIENGVAEFVGITINNAGDGYRLEAQAEGLQSVMTSPFDVSGPPARLNVSRQPGGRGAQMEASADQPLAVQPVVTVLDFDGKIVRYDQFPATISVSFGLQGALFGSMEAAVIRGEAYFEDLQIQRATDAAVITFHYEGSLLEASVSAAPFQVLSGPAHHLQITQQPGASTRGLALGLQPALRMLDAWENAVSWYSSSVEVQLFQGRNDTTAYLQGTPTAAFDTAGTAEFVDLAVQIEGDGFSMNFQSSGFRAFSQTFNIKQGPPSGLASGSIRTPAGVFNTNQGLLEPQPVIHVVDLGGFKIDSMDGSNCAGEDCLVSVILICCPLNFLGDYIGTASLLGTTSVVTSQGAAYFTDLQLDAVGEYTLRFIVEEIEGVSGRITGDVEHIFVQAITSLSLSTQPSHCVLGLPLRYQPVVDILDESGDVVKASLQNVSVEIAAGVGCSSLSGTTTVMVHEGVATFTDLAIGSFVGGSNCQLNFTSSFPVLNLLSDSFATSFGPPSLTVSTQPSGIIAGSPFQVQPILQFRELGGVLLTSESGQAVSAEIVRNGGDTSCGIGSCAVKLSGTSIAYSVEGETKFTDLRVDTPIDQGYVLRFTMGRYMAMSGVFNVSIGAAAQLVVMRQPSDVRINSNMQPSVLIAIQDGGGNVATTANDTITANVLPVSAFGTAITGGTIGAVEGVAEFASLQLSQAALLLSLRFSTSTLAVDTDSFSVHESATQLVLRQFEVSDFVAGERMTPEPQLAVVDQLGFVTASDSSSGVSAFLGGTALFNTTLYRGIAQFGDVRLLAAGNDFSIRFVLIGNPAIYVDSPTFSVQAASAASLTIVQQPQTTRAGLIMYPFPAVQLLDHWSNPILFSADVVEACVSNHSVCMDALRLEGGIQSSPVEGQASFSSLVLTTDPRSGVHILFTLVGSNSAVSPVESEAFEVKRGLPMLSILQQPGSASRGQSMSQQPVIAITDPALTMFDHGIDFLAVTASLEQFSVSGATLSDSAGSCPCIARFRSGVAEFEGLQVSDAGAAFAIRFSAPVLKLPDVVSEPFVVSGAAIYFQVSGLQSTIPYRQDFELEVRILDPNSNPVPSTPISVELRRKDGTSAELLFGVTIREAGAGVAIFSNLQISEVGDEFFLRFASDSMHGNSELFNVVGRNATNIVIDPFPPQVLAGQELSNAPNISVVDEFGFPAAFNDTVSVQVQNSNADFNQAYDIRVSSGLASLENLVLQNAGTGFVVTVEAALASLGTVVSASSNQFEVLPGQLAQLVVALQPSNGILSFALSQQPMVAAQDSVGNVLTDFDKLISVTLNANISSDVTVMTGTTDLVASGGVATFTDLAFQLAGVYSLLVSTTEACGVESVTNTFAITGPVVNVSVSIAPVGADGGSAFVQQPQVILRDASGEVVLAADQPVVAEECGELVEVKGVSTVYPTDGIVSFNNLYIDSVGTFSICFRFDVFSASRTLTVAIGDARFVSIVTQPVILQADTEWSAGAPTPELELTDAGGNVISTSTFLYVEIVDTRTRVDTLKIKEVGALEYSEGQAQVQSNAITALRINRPARQIQAKFSIVGTSASVTSQLFDVVGGSCAQMRVIVQPGDEIVGETFKRHPSVQVEDEQGNVAAWIDSTLLLQIGSAHFADSELSGCETSQSPIDGVATFVGCSISCTAAVGTTGCLGTDFTLTFIMPNCDDSPITVTSNAFHLSEPANTIAVSALAASTEAAVPFNPQPTVSLFSIPCGLEDFCPVRISDATNVVSAQLENLGVNATLRGTTSAAIVDGVATFTDLAISEAMAGYNISFTTPNIPVANVFMDIVVGSVASLRVSSQPSLTRPAGAFGCKVSLHDAGGNSVDDAGEQIAITVGLVDDISAFYGSVLDTSQASLTQVSVLGEAEWTGLTVYLAPAVYTFVFSGTTVNGLDVSTTSERIALSIGSLFELRLLSQPESRESGALLNPIFVQLFDEGGNPVVNSPVLITATLSAGSGTLSGDTSMATSGGIAVFSNLTVAYSTGNSHSQLQFTVASIFVRSNPFFVHLSPNYIVLRTWPSENGVVSVPLAQQPQVEVRDNQHNRVFGSNSLAVTASLEGSRSLATYSCEANYVPAPSCTTNVLRSDLPLGIANPVLSIKVEQTDFKAAGEFLTAVTVGGQAITYDDLSTTGEDGLCGTYVTIAENIPLPDDDVVAVFLSTPIGVDCCPCSGLYLHAIIEVYYDVFAGNDTAIVEDGLATFTDLTITQAGTYRFSFSYGNESIQSTNITVSAGEATTLVMQNDYQPGASTNNASKYAGVALPVQPRVRLLDNGGGPPANSDLLVVASVAPSSGAPGEEVLFGSAAILPDAQTGIAAFTDLAVNLVGTFVLTFTWGSLSVSSERFTVVVGPIAQIVFSVQPGNAVFGALIGRQPRVLLLDTGGNRVQGTPWLHIALQEGRDVGSSLEGCSEEYAALDQGEVVFEGCYVSGTVSGAHSVVVHTVLTGDIVADVTDSDTLTLESDPIFISGTPSGLNVTVLASDGTSSEHLPVQPVLSVVDASGAAVRSVNGSISVSIHGPGNLTGSTVVEVTEGAAAFTDLLLVAAGKYRLSFHQKDFNFTVFQNLTVAPGPPAGIVLSNLPVLAVAGSVLADLEANAPAAFVSDLPGNSAADGTLISVSMNCSRAGSCLNGTLSARTQRGTATFSDVVPLQAGIMQLTFSPAGASDPFATAVLEVVAGNLSRLVFVVQPPSAMFVRTVIDPAPAVELRDRFQNRLISFEGNFTFFLERTLLSGAELLGERRAAAQHGIAKLEGASLSSASVDYRLGCTGSGLTAESNMFSVYERHCCLRLVEMPQGSEGGSPFAVHPRLLLLDKSGKLSAVTGPSVSVALEFGATSLSGQTQVTAVQGEAVFTNLTLDKVGTFRLVFSSEGSDGVTTVTSADLTVFPGTPKRLEVYRQPGGFASGGLPFPTQPVVLAVDAGGNVANQSVEVTASLVNASSGARITGDTQRTSGSLLGAPLESHVLGAAVFDELAINLVGAFRLAFSSAGLLSAISNSFYVELGPAARLGVFNEPADAVSGLVFGSQPQIHVHDAGGNLVEMLSYVVNVEILSHATRYPLLSEVVLGGNAVIDSHKGVAQFTDLFIDTPGEFCILRFTSPGLAEGESKQFAVAPASPLSGCPAASTYFSDCGPSTNRAFFLDVQTQPSSTSCNETMRPAPVVVLRDFDGNQIAKDGEVHISLVAPATGLHASPAMMIGGAANISDLRIDTIGTALQLRFAFGVLWVETATFDVLAGSVAGLQLSDLPVEWVINRPLPTFSVTLLDQGGNVASEFSACPSLVVSTSVGPAAANLSGTILASVVDGEVSFSDIVVVEAGHYVLRVACADTSSAMFSIHSGEIAILPYGIPTDIEFVTSTADAIASFDDASAFKPYFLQSSPAVAMVDSAGNVVKGFKGLFTVTQNTTSTGILLGDGDAISGYPRLGTGTFENLFFEISTPNFQRGAISLIFQSTAPALATTLSTVVRSNARVEAASVLLPASAETGEGFAATVNFETADSTMVSIYRGQVDVYLTDAATNQTLAWAFTDVQEASVSGGSVVVSGLVASSAGSYRLLVRASRPVMYLPELVFHSRAFNIGSGVPRSLQILVQPAGCVGGVACTTQPVLHVLDRVGNLVPATGVQVTASIVGDHAGTSLTGTLTATGSDDNVTFADLTVGPSGYALMNFSGPGFVISDPVLVVVGERAKARVFVEPSGLEAGLPFMRQPIALAADSGGNWVEGITDVMEVDFACGFGCTQFGNFTAPTRNGVAEFTDLGVNFAGQIQLRFRLSSVVLCSGSCWESTNLLTVQPGVLAQLVIRSNISEYVCSATTITPSIEVEVQDAQGNLLSTGDTFTISVTLPVSAEGLSGTLAVETVAGVASFADLAVAPACSRFSTDPVALCFSLLFSSGMVTASSSAFSVLAGPAVGIQFNENPADTVVGHRAGISSLSLADAQGNPFVQLPAGFVNSCGGNTLLDPATITSFLATEQLMGNTVVLGQGREETAGASVAFTGIAVNWNVASCPSAADCRPGSENDYRIMRLRASANFGSYVADSGTFAVDVAQPVNFQVTLTSHSSIILEWNAPFHGPIPSHYLLRFQTTGSMPDVWVELEVATTEFTLSDIWYADLYKFELCSQSLFGEGCAIKPPAPVIAAAVEPAQAAELVYVGEHFVILSWTDPALGPRPTSYRVTAIEVPDGFENEVQAGVSGANFTVLGLMQNTTYVLKLYPRAARGDFHAPTGPATAEFLLTPAAENVTVQCPSDVCTGSSLEVAWAHPQRPMIRPDMYRISTERTIAGSATQTQLDVAETVTSVVLDNLEKGSLTTIRVQARNRVFPTFFGLSATIEVVPVSPPSPPAQLLLRMVGTTLVQIDWTAPTDSGDGTPDGIAIVSYLLDYKALGAAEFEAVERISGRSFTVAGLQSGTNYTFRVRAETAPVIGSICAVECARIAPLDLTGAAAERTLVFGRVPVWDELQAPPAVDPPTLYNLFVGVLFSLQVRALSVEAGQIVSITASGLSDCGAELVADTVAQASTSTLLFLPSAQQMDKTFWICFLATDSYGAFSDERCVRLFVVSPRPTFVSPAQALGNPDAPTVEAVAGCELSFEVTAHDLTSGQHVTALEAASRGYLVRIESDASLALSLYGEAQSPSIPEGAALEEGPSAFGNPVSRTFRWTPARGQEAFAYLVCFRARDSLATYNSASAVSAEKFCARIRVARCRYCMKAGDSLFSIAEQWGTQWLNLWSGNDLLLRPAQAIEQTEVMLGPLYSASHQDSLNSLAAKFSVNADQILAWNPDLQAEAGRGNDPVIFSGQEVCVLPSTCTI